MSWEIKNHGGRPTSNSDKKYAIFIGRFQPYHYGHIELIEQKLKNGSPILIMVRDIEPDEKNPWTAKEIEANLNIELSDLISQGKEEITQVEEEIKGQSDSAWFVLVKK